LGRFTEIFDIFCEILNDKLLQTVDGQMFMSYLAGILEQLNMLHKQLQEGSKTLTGAPFPNLHGEQNSETLKIADSEFRVYLKFQLI
jgi:hypothetical protein